MASGTVARQAGDDWVRGSGIITTAVESSCGTYLPSAPAATTYCGAGNDTSIGCGFSVLSDPDTRPVLPLPAPCPARLEKTRDLLLSSDWLDWT